MASATVMADVRTRLDSGWSHCPISHPNSPAQTVPANGDPFLAVQYPVSTETLISIGDPGNNLYREEGAIRLVLSIPRGADIEAWTAWLDDARRLMRGQEFGVVRTYEASPPVTDDRVDDGKYWKIATVITYDADFYG